MHRASVVGRLRADPGLLLLMTLVVALTTALTTAVEPLTVRTADRAVAATVRDAGERADVVATLPDGEQPETRDPLALVEFQQDGEYALSSLPDRLAAVLSPGVATLSTPTLQLLDAGPGRYLRLAYAETPDGPPAVEYVAGGPPQATAEAGSPWPVQVALSESAASALDLGPGDRVEAEDEQRRSVIVVVSGVYAAADPGDEVWRTLPALLEASQGVSEGSPRTSATALVGADSLPDLRFGVPADDLSHRVTFTPRPERLRWRQADELGRDVVALQASAGLARFNLTWDSLLERVLDDGLAQIATARGQAQVLLLGLLTVALLVLLLAAGLLVRRRAGPLALARERGATLLGLGVELGVESGAVALVGVALGLGVTVLLTGGPAGGGCCRSWSSPRWPPRSSAPSRRPAPPTPAGSRPTAPRVVRRCSGAGSAAWPSTSACWPPPPSPSPRCTSAGPWAGPRRRARRPSGRWRADSSCCGCCRPPSACCCVAPAAPRVRCGS